VSAAGCGLGPVRECVARWRRVAWSSAGPEAEREMPRQAGRLSAGELVPTIALAGLRAAVLGDCGEMPLPKGWEE
jgi:Family of unknown function (DUF6247)